MKITDTIHLYHGSDACLSFVKQQTGTKLIRRDVLLYNKQSSDASPRPYCTASLIKLRYTVLEHFYSCVQILSLIFTSLQRCNLILGVTPHFYSCFASIFNYIKEKKMSRTLWNRTRD